VLEQGLLFFGCFVRECLRPRITLPACEPVAVPADGVAIGAAR
jgi:hypothetical protein